MKLYNQIYILLMISIITFGILVNAIDFNSCEMPRNNKERLSWMNQLVVQTQEILNNFGMTSWISQGTLLGSFRDNGTIPWTGDADVHTFSENIKSVCNHSSAIAQSFRNRNMSVYGCNGNHLNVCFANTSLKPAPKFVETHISPESRLELYGCSKMPDGLYTIPYNVCIWNFTSLFPLKKYRLDENVYALGPNKALYWVEQYYGKSWREPNVYSGNKKLYDICVGDP